MSDPIYQLKVTRVMGGQAVTGIITNLSSIWVESGALCWRKVGQPFSDGFSGMSLAAGVEFHMERMPEEQPKLEDNTPKPEYGH